MPTAPVPAYPSSTRAPSIRGASTLNSVSLSLSEVGRRPSQSGASSFLPFSDPAITLMKSPAASHQSGDLYQSESLFPRFQHFCEDGRRRRCRLDPRLGLALRAIENHPVADEIDRPERRHAGL